jgi:hypothetical protein
MHEGIVRPIQLFIHLPAIHIQFIYTEEMVSFLQLICQRFEFLFWFVKLLPFILRAFVSASCLNDSFCLTIAFKEVDLPLYSIGVIFKLPFVDVSYSES